MSVRGFTFESGPMDQFMDIGYGIYRDDSNWIPPTRSHMARQLKADFPFYHREGNHHRKFVATAGGKILGRIAAMINSEMKTGDGEQIGTVGFFECIDDHHVAADLLSTSLQWLTGEMGVRHIWGPMNFDIWHGYRFMTRGFDQDLFFGEPYNKPYYPDLFEDFGFKPVYRWDSLEIKGRELLQKVMSRGRKRYSLLKDRGYRFETLDRRRFGEEMKKLYAMLTVTFAGFPGFTPLSYDEFLNLHEGIRLAVNPELIVFIYNEEGQAAGFAAAFLDLAEAVRVTGGRRNPISLARFATKRRRIDRVNFYLGGVTPEEIARGSGLGRVGFFYILNQALGLNYEKVLLSLRMLGNPSRSLPGPAAPRPQREYALYGYSR